jgi:uncharacterized peroxidase-related enzyme
MMRLKIVETGHRLPQRLKLAFIQLGSRHEPADVLKTLYYRPEFFGRSALNLAQTLLRGPSPWTVGERELFAAFVSAQNQCPFCTGAHGAVASTAFGPEATQAVLEDFETAPIRETLRAALRFLRKLTLTPDEVGATDVNTLRHLGLSDVAMGDVIAIAAAFNVIDRVANALGFAVPSPETFAVDARFLLRLGYR